MPKLMKGRSQKAGLPPGTLIHIGEAKREKTEITLFSYNEHSFEEENITMLDKLSTLKDTPNIKWINVDGLHQVELLEKLGAQFGLHPLVLEDILNTQQRPKLEDYGEYLYIVLKMIYYDDKLHSIVTEQVSLVLGKDFVLSFQEDGGDVFGAIRDRIRTGVGRLRKQGADYLAYSLLDAIVDNYFTILEKVGDKIEDIEDTLMLRPSSDSLNKVHHLRRQMLFLHKSVWPLREVIGGLERGDSPLIEESTEVYLRDIYDHVVQSMDAIETYRDIVSGMLDIYLSSINNRMNEVIKVLTIISTLFMPLTFIAGVYGMNFKYMPELEQPWGYPAVMGLMLAISVSMLIYFRRKKWI